MILQSLKMAFKSILSNKLRSFLTMLGIIIGVMSLVVLVSLVNGATTSVTDQISALGSDLLTVTVSDDKGAPLKLDTLGQWMEADGVGLLAPVSQTSATGKYGTESDSVTVYGTTAAYETIEGLQVEYGRWLKTTDVDSVSFVCVLNATAAEDLVGYADCLGESVSLDGMKFTVVGVLSDDESLTSSFLGDSLVAYIPYTALMRLSSGVSSSITSFYAAAADGSTVEETETALTALLMDRFENDEDAFTVSSQNVIEDAMSSITSVLEILLGGIAGISLIVGGIGIMNIMLVSVTERTREIGIRKAIGATRGMILRQFLLEALTLCMLGCFFGIALSWVILRIVSVVVSSLDLTFQLQGNVVLISVLFSAAIGILFGIYPANKAAKMEPIEALHYGG